MRFSLVPRNTRFEDLLVQAAHTAHEASLTLQRMLATYPDSPEIIGEIRDLEHAGDSLLRKVVKELRAAFVTPIDREDIYELAIAIDDVVDHIDECAQMFDTYQVESATDCVRQQADILVRATQELSSALTNFDTVDDMERHWTAIHALEDEGDTLLRHGIKEVYAACYNEPAVIICWKDIYTQLEEAVDACERAATVLEAIQVKNG